MRTPIIFCDSCGSESVRRSKRQTLSELLRMSTGMYPFRCMDCDRRFWVSVWLFSKLPFAKCPKCLNVQLTTWPAKYFAPTLWRSVAVMLGAHRYRCMPCRHNFISFRTMQPTIAESAAGQGGTEQPETERALAESKQPVLAGDPETPKKD